jgi:RimJ/RimL family protein N-acetyltransferase
MKAAVDASIEHLLPWMPWAAAEPQSVDQKVELIRRFRSQFDLGEDFVMGIFDRDETQALGGTGLHPRVGAKAVEIGYWIRHEFINQGLATETAAALTRVAFEVNQLDRVEIHCDPRNVRSSAVPRKLGYQLEANLRRRLVDTDGERRDVMIWTIFAADYPASPIPEMAATVEAFDALGRSLL